MGEKPLVQEGSTPETETHFCHRFPWIFPIWIFQPNVARCTHKKKRFFADQFLIPYRLCFLWGGGGYIMFRCGLRCFFCAAMVQDAVAAMSELELLFKYLDAMGTLKVRSTHPLCFVIEVAFPLTRL